MAEALSFLTALFRFWPQVVELVKLLQKTPAQKHADILSAILAASHHADETRGDTSGYENVLKGR